VPFVIGGFPSPMMDQAGHPLLGRFGLFGEGQVIVVLFENLKHCLYKNGNLASDISYDKFDDTIGNAMRTMLQLSDVVPDGGIIKKNGRFLCEFDVVDFCSFSLMGNICTNLFCFYFQFCVTSSIPH
jgi:hypothetical protein